MKDANRTAPVKPVDPRSRAVVASRRDRHIWVLTLDCGHEQRQTGCVPARAICRNCPPAGGQGRD